MADMLTDDQKQKLREAQRALADAIPVIQKLEACGENCQELKSQVEYWIDKVQAYRNNFGG